MNRPFGNILETIGRTPVVRINKLAPKDVNLFVKLESFNPMGSIKDRLALGVIEDAERTGALKPGQTVIEATSGNTGIVLAMVCAHKGYPLVVTMAENFSIERRKMMRFLGAKVVLTPADQMGTGMLAKAVELAEEHGWFLCHQFENEANAAMHSQTTAPEILETFADIGLDYWVTGFGTGGTLKGVSRVLKEKSPNTRVIVCEPDNSAVLASGLPQARNPDGSPAESHKAFRPHLMQGWSPDFIPKLVGDTVDSKWIDELIAVKGTDAIRCSQQLAREEGIFVGISSGATFSGALSVCREAAPGSNVLCMLPDTGERYLSTPLFEDISAQMTGEEIEISRSTESFRFDVTPVTAAETEHVPATRSAHEFVNNVTREHKVVMFALEWCEFCWSVRKLFAKLGVTYKSVDLDSSEYAENDRGGDILRALTEQTGCITIPQIFYGGEFLGGCTDTFDALNSGKLQQIMKQNGIGFDASLKIDPYDLLPKWLEPR